MDWYGYWARRYEEPPEETDEEDYPGPFAEGG